MKHKLGQDTHIQPVMMMMMMIMLMLMLMLMLLLLLLMMMMMMMMINVADPRCDSGQAMVWNRNSYCKCDFQFIIACMCNRSEFSTNRRRASKPLNGKVGLRWSK